MDLHIIWYKCLIPWGDAINVIKTEKISLHECCKTGTCWDKAGASMKQARCHKILFLFFWVRSFPRKGVIFLSPFYNTHH